MPIINNSPNKPIEDEIRSLLADFLLCDSQSIVISQLKDGVVNCYNNTNYAITISNKKYFAKHANPNGEVLETSLANDITCRTIAATHGISTPVLLYNPKKTILITEFLEIKQEVDFKNLIIKKRYVDLLHMLHTSGVQFPLKFCPCELLAPKEASFQLELL